MMCGGGLVSLVDNEFFSFEDLQQLNISQLRRIITYFNIDFSLNDSKMQLINKIMDFQKSKRVWDENSNWKPEVQRSVRVQRLYELNVLGKKQ